jgi:hypothetical protein
VVLLGESDIPVQEGPRLLKPRGDDDRRGRAAGLGGTTTLTRVLTNRTNVSDATSTRVHEALAVQGRARSDGVRWSGSYYGWVVYNEALASRVRIVLAAQSGVEEKRMFGGVSFMVGGQSCCAVLKGDLVIRVGPDRFDEVLAQPDVRPFDFTGRPSRGMVYVASSGLASEQALRAWVQRGLDYVKTHPKATKPTKRIR